MKARRIVLAGVLIAGAMSPAAAQETNGAFSAYLVGTYEHWRLGWATMFEIVNPTPEPIQLVGAFYDYDGRFLYCNTAELGANDKQEIPIWWLSEAIPSEHGVFKAISFKREGGGFVPVVGIVGFERHCHRTVGCTESNLAGVPLGIAAQELEMIARDCSLR
jgi:hypothetical protein